MKCPNCGHLEDKVLETRVQRDGEIIRRRRECLHCKERYSTQECRVLTYPLIAKKDGRREPFDREKLLKGIQAACQKRAISLSQMEQIVNSVSNSIIERAGKEVTTEEIGEKVIDRLRQLDDVAYVRFASVYRTFRDVQEFFQTLEASPDQIGK